MDEISDWAPYMPVNGPCTGARPLSLAIYWFITWDMRLLNGTASPCWFTR